MHLVMQNSAEMKISGFEVMQECISYAHTYADFGRNGNGKNCDCAELHKLCMPLCRFRQEMKWQKFSYTGLHKLCKSLCKFRQEWKLRQSETRKLHKLCSYLCTFQQDSDYNKNTLQVWKIHENEEM